MTDRAIDQAAFGLELKFASDEAGEMTFAGLAAVFGNVDSHGDVIKAGAFTATLREAELSGRYPAMLAQHGGFGLDAESQMPIGIWTKLEQVERGLKATGKLADTPRGREAYQLMRMQPRPAIDGLSIGYHAKKYTLGTKPGEPRRTLEAIDLVEISLVTFPANPKARVTGVKSIRDCKSIRDFEELIRTGALSGRDAKRVANVSWPTFQHDDEEELAFAAELRRITNLSTE